MSEVADYSHGEPPPVPNGSVSVHDLVYKDLLRQRPTTALLLGELIHERKALGLKKYNTILQAGNGRNALKDLLEELADAIAYARQLMEERPIGAMVVKQNYLTLISVAMELLELQKAHEDALR